MPASSVLRFIVTFSFCLIVVATYAQNNQEISISGTLLMLDDKIPHVAGVAQVEFFLIPYTEMRYSQNTSSKSSRIDWNINDEKLFTDSKTRTGIHV